MTPSPHLQRQTLRRRTVAHVLVVIGLAVSLPAIARSQAGARRGTPVTLAPGVRQTVQQLMALQAVTPLPSHPELMPEYEGPERGDLPQNPSSPAVPSFPRVPVGRKGLGAFQVQTPQTLGTSFTGATLSGTYSVNAFPPDCMGAVGPTQYVVMVNNRIVSFNKTTGAADGVINMTTNTFFNSVRGGAATSDPRIRYDRLTGRWIFVIINVPTPNRILIAVSDAASAGVLKPSTTFTYFYIPIDTTPPAISSNCFADYPTLGVDANALYIGTNDFCGATSKAFVACDGYVVRKSSILGAGPLVVTVFRDLVPTTNGPGPYTPQGVDNYDPAATEGYFIGPDNASHGTLVLRRVSNPGGTPSISGNLALAVPTTSDPLPVPHLGNTGGTQGELDALDDRLFAAHLRNGRLWTAHNLGLDNTGTSPGAAPTRDGARWYELAVPTGSGGPTLVQSGTVYTPSAMNTGDQRYYWIPSIMVSGQGHAAMGFSTAGTGEHANAATIGRLVSDPLGTMETPELITNSSTAYNPTADDGSSRGARRWGDYSYTSLDPLDDMTMWTVQEFCDASNSFGVRVTKLIPPPPATPVSLGDVTPGQSAVSVTLYGTSASGSGWYDPGADLPGVPAFHHVAVSSSSGGASGTPPTVVSATYVNPTTINLVLNTTSATVNQPGEKYTVTVTNPDGQVASAAVLHVVSSVPSVSIGAGPSLSEGNSGTTAFTFPVTLSAMTASPVTVYYHTVDGTATAADGDFQPATSSITLPPNTAGGTISVSVVGDTKHEGDETFSVQLTGAASATVGTPSSGSATILNDDAVPTATLTTGPITQPEGDSGVTPYPYAVTLSNATDQTVTIAYHTVDGTATAADGDYQAANTMLTIPAGATSGSITVNGVGDTRYEPDETFRLVLSSPVNATLVAPTSVTSTLVNDDPIPLVAIADTSAVEGDTGTSIMNFRVSLSNPAGDAVDVSYQTSDGTATAGADYVAASGVVTIPANGTSALVPIQVLGDRVKESNETFTLNVTDVTNAQIGDDQAIGTIVDDDSLPRITIGDVSVAEGNSGTTMATFPITLSNATDQSITVDWHTADGTATVAGLDYVAATGTLTLPPKTTMDSIQVVVNGDTQVEADETFMVNLSNPANAVIEHAQGTATIVNDDGATAVQGAPVTAFALGPVIPNPTSVPIQLEYALPRAAHVRLTIDDLQGREVASVVDAERGPGRYRARWNTRDARGTASPGVYFVRFEAPGVRIQRRFAIVR